MIYKDAPNWTDIGSSKTHALVTTPAGFKSNPFVRCWTSSMLVALLGAMATIALVAGSASAALVYSVNSSASSSASSVSNQRSTWNTLNRAAWEASAAAGAVRVTDDFSSVLELTNPTSPLTSLTSFSGKTAATQSATGTTSPAAGASPADPSFWTPNGTPYSFDAGNTTVNWYTVGSAGLSLGTSTRLGAGNTGNMLFSSTSSTSQWGWLSFTPDVPVAGFGVDFYSSATHDYSDVGFFSWRVTMDDGTKTIGRLTSALDLTAGVGDLKVGQDQNAGWYNTYIQAAAAYAPSFFGVRSDNSTNISKVEFFTHYNGTSFAFDNVSTETVQSVPEPAAVAPVGLVAMVALLRLVRRR